MTLMYALMTLTTFKYSCYARMYHSKAGEVADFGERCESVWHLIRKCRIFVDIHSEALATGDDGAPCTYTGSRIDVTLVANRLAYRGHSEDS